MKIAYLDCFSGISGDMTVGAFLDAGLKFSLLEKRLRGLGIGGYKISAARVKRNAIAGIKFDVRLKEKRPLKHVTHREIKKLIGQSRVSDAVKRLSLSIFDNLALAEAKVHGVNKNDVRFHEAGALDSIVDIVSTAIAVIESGVKKFYCLNLKLGKGNIDTQHGNIPLPAPAVLEMLKGKPLSFKDVGYELVTPTGAAILTALVEDFSSIPDINIEAIGYGAGSMDFKEDPNLLRVAIGTASAAGLIQEEIFVIETNIDDMNPNFYEYVMERLFKKGALDVYLTPVYMKKTRPGVLLTVLATQSRVNTLAALIMKETTSSGVRQYKVQRQKLERSIKTVKTQYGPVRIKVNTGPEGIRTASPEYEDCRRLAIKTGVPFKIIYDCAKKKIG